MPKSLDPFIIAELEARNSDQRYSYLIEQVITDNEVWIIADEGGSVLLEEDGVGCIPVWPHRECAEENLTGDWADCKAISIEKSAWLERWTTGLTEDSLLIAVFPDSEQECVVVSPAEFDDEIRS
jgi:hypothetical protein